MGGLDLQVKLVYLKIVSIELRTEKSDKTRAYYRRGYGVLLLGNFCVFLGKKIDVSTSVG